MCAICVFLCACLYIICFFFLNFPPNVNCIVYAVMHYVLYYLMLSSKYTCDTMVTMYLSSVENKYT